MEEDIKECEDLIRILDKTSETGKSKHTDCIRNLIARNKELEESLKFQKKLTKIAQIITDESLKEALEEIEKDYIPKPKVKELFDELISYNLKGNLEDSKNILKIIQKYKKILGEED